MLISELLEKYYFRDSNVIKLSHIGNDFILEIDICNWKQKDYKDKDEEISLKKIIFNKIERYNWDSDKCEDEIDYDTILAFDCLKNSDGYDVKIVLEDDDISVITFKGIEVSIT